MVEPLAFYKQAPGLLFIMAKDAAKRAHKATGTLGEQIEAMAAVVLCAVVAEASINQIGEYFDGQSPYGFTADLPVGFSELEVRTKWSLFPSLCRLPSFDRSKEPWQSFEALIDLRNYIVHLRLRSLSSKAKGLLTAKGLLEDNSLIAQTAHWACHTISSMLEELTRLLGIPARFIGMTWTWTPAHSFPYGLSTPGDLWPGDELDPKARAEFLRRSSVERTRPANDPKRIGR